MGAIGIIWFHLHLPNSQLGLSALPMFVTFFVCFGLGRDIAALNRRLLFPWVIWSGVFGIAKLAQAIVSGGSLTGEFAGWMLLTGPAIHLWFLPFSYVFVLGMARIGVQARRLFVILVWPCAFWFGGGDVPQPFAQWITVLPAACLGLLLNALGSRSLWAHGIGWGSVGLALGIAILGGPAMALPYAIGCGAVLLALALRVPATPFSRLLAETSFGIYLLHPLVCALVLYLPLGGIAVQAAVVVLATVILARMVRRVTPRLV
jgi:surface polysaccharide O-acyltransferase-like enzyme